jgi:galactokinase
MEHTAVDARATLLPHFESTFGAKPTHVVRAPGRVNLIGEHTDYNGLPVFPMAIQRAVTIALRARADARVCLVNVDARFGAREFELADEIEPFAQGDWGNYAKAAAAILRERAGITRGFDAAVHGDIPPAAGLSSSSALVVACLLGFAVANQLELAPEEMMNIAARGERYVGVESGGMDQAISLGGRAGHAVVIDFDPLRLRPTRVPDDWRFVIANSFVSAEKSGRARAAYNERVAECREALRRIRAHPDAASWPNTYHGLVASVATQELVTLGDTALPALLARRFRHVVSEGARVELARQAMLAQDFARFGELMNSSHASLRDDYEVSCVELDTIVSAALELGAAGARLTGAGFGGCAVLLCRDAQADELVRALDERLARSDRVGRRERMLVTVACDGASTVTLDA